uniref:Uncharacterized protein n=1 Tax=Echinococcus granulosus TaxID=6210 RepID=A0A068X471_ECHGR|nr:hypothetical protein EgrG_000397500 [Echinococcus granulosus]
MVIRASFGDDISHKASSSPPLTFTLPGTCSRPQLSTNHTIWPWQECHSLKVLNHPVNMKTAASRYVALTHYTNSRNTFRFAVKLTSKNGSTSNTFHEYSITQNQSRQATQFPASNATVPRTFAPPTPSPSLSPHPRPPLSNALCRWPSGCGEEHI